MYILFKSDGSIKTINLTDYIQKGNDGVNSIFCAIEDKNTTQWSADAYFKLPDGYLFTVEALETTTQNIDGIYYPGYIVPITDDVTAFVGLLTFSLRARNTSNNKTLFTFAYKLVVNPAVSPDLLDETKISVAQYNALKDRIQTLQKFPFSGTDTIQELYEKTEGKQCILRKTESGDLYETLIISIGEGKYYFYFRSLGTRVVSIGQTTDATPTFNNLYYANTKTLSTSHFYSHRLTVEYSGESPAPGYLMVYDTNPEEITAASYASRTKNAICIKISGIDFATYSYIPVTIELYNVFYISATDGTNTGIPKWSSYYITGHSGTITDTVTEL